MSGKKDNKGGREYDRGENRGPARRRSRRKVCAFCVDKVTEIDYKEVAKLRKYISKEERSFREGFQAIVQSISAS